MNIRSELIKEAAGLLDSKALTNLRELAEFRKVLSARRVRHWIEEIEREHREAAVRLKKIADDDVVKKLENATLLVRRAVRDMQRGGNDPNSVMRHLRHGVRETVKRLEAFLEETEPQKAGGEGTNG